MKKYKIIVSILVIGIFFSGGIASFFGASSDNVTPVYDGDKYVYAIKVFEKQYEAKFPHRNLFINLNYQISEFLWKNDFKNNSVYKSIDGMLYSYDVNRCVSEAYSQEFYNSSIENLTALQQLSENKGIDMLFALAPSRSINEYTYLPANITDYSISNRNNFIEKLQESGIAYLDLENSVSTNTKPNERFYKTDHHWTTLCSMAAAKGVCEELNTRYGYSLNAKLLETDNFDIVNYPNRFLGSIGIRIAQNYEREDFSIAIPKFNTEFAYTLNNWGEKKVFSGTFEKAFIDYALLQDYNYLNTYVVNLYDISFEGIIENKLMPNGKRCLLIADSFSRNFAQFFSLNFSETAIIDPQPGRYNEEISKYIDNFSPDTIVYLCNGQTLYHNLNL